VKKCVSEDPPIQDVPPNYPPPLDWSDLVALLNDKLSSEAIADKLR